MSRIAEEAYGDTPAPYPKSPGFKTGGTSQEAALFMGLTADNLREKVLHVIQQSENGLTADEVATKLNKTVLSIRPRVAELKASGRIKDSENRRLNSSGRSAVVWRLV